MRKNYSRQIKQIILSMEEGKVFSIKDLQSVKADNKTIERNILRLKEEEIIETISSSRGLYYKPANHPLIGKVRPSEQKIIEAYEKKINTVLYISGSRASNLLGLTTQVAEKSVYYTNKQLQPLKLGKREILFKRKAGITAREDKKAFLILSALEYLGPVEAYREETRKKIKEIIKIENNIIELTNSLPAFRKWLSIYIKTIGESLEADFKSIS